MNVDPFGADYRPIRYQSMPDFDIDFFVPDYRDILVTLLFAAERRGTVHGRAVLARAAPSRRPRLVVEREAGGVAFSRSNCRTFCTVLVGSSGGRRNSPRTVRSTTGDGAVTSSTKSERERFEAVTIPASVVSVGEHQQASARRLLTAGWVAFGDERIEAVGRARRAGDCGRRFGAIVVEDVAA